MSKSTKIALTRSFYFIIIQVGKLSRKIFKWVENYFSDLSGKVSRKSQVSRIFKTGVTPMSNYALHPHIPALQRAQNVTPHLYNTDYYITKLNRLNIICLLKHSLVSSTIVISVVSTFNIALVLLNLYAILLFIVKSSLQCATEIIIN